MTVPFLSFTTIDELGVPAFFRVVAVGFKGFALAEPTKRSKGAAERNPAATMSGTRRRREDVMLIYFNKKRAE
jgi:hypothetical protein